MILAIAAMLVANADKKQRRKKMNLNAINELMKCISSTKECEMDDTLTAVAALVLGSIRKRKGNEFLKGFCHSATCENAPEIYVTVERAH